MARKRTPARAGLARAVLIAAGALAGALAGAAAAQPEQPRRLEPAVRPGADPDRPPAAREKLDAAQGEQEDRARTLEEWIELLNSPVLGDREAATLALSQMSEALAQRLNPERLAALSPEQRYRVETILRQRFFASPRAGLGVSFRPLIEDGVSLGVRIELVVDGFPAKEMLEAGDVIVGIDGRSLLEMDGLRSDTALRHAILSREPGDAIDLVVERDDERLELSVPTGSFAQLRDAQRPDVRLLHGAWRWRLDRMGLEPGGTLRLPATEEASWRSELRLRGDIPPLAPAGRPAAALAGERSVPALAEAEGGGVDKRALVLQGRIRQLETRLNQTQELLAERRRDLRAALAESKEAIRLRNEVQSLERQMSVDRLQLQRLLIQVEQ